jgi:hypothetical protein
MTYGIFLQNVHFELWGSEDERTLGGGDINFDVYVETSMLHREFVRVVVDVTFKMS